MIPSSAYVLRLGNRGDGELISRQMLSAHLQQADPIMYDIIEKVRHGLLLATDRANADSVPVEQEKVRQKQFINLIPSENFTSQAVLDALGSPMQSA